MLKIKALNCEGQLCVVIIDFIEFRESYEGRKNVLYCSGPDWTSAYFCSKEKAEEFVKAAYTTNYVDLSELGNEIDVNEGWDEINEELEKINESIDYTGKMIDRLRDQVFEEEHNKERTLSLRIDVFLWCSITIYLFLTFINITFSNKDFYLFGIEIQDPSVFVFIFLSWLLIISAIKFIDCICKLDD